MKLVSVTLSGNCDAIIADAIHSVLEWVDNVILIDTGIKDRTIEVARKIAGDKLVVKNYPWKNDFAAARNYSLECAKEENADWAIILDTDERIVSNGVNFRDYLESTKFNCIAINDRGRTYQKARFFRIPVTEKFYGPTHEVFPAYKVGSCTEENSHFWEVGKNPEQLKNKFQRDIDILLKHTKKNPNDPRWFYYLGESYKNIGNQNEAIRAYTKCHELNGWDEESAWSMYRAAECYISQDKLQNAIEALARGIGRHPGLADLYWLAGRCAYKLNRYHHAIMWSRQAINMGLYSGHGSSFERIGFRHPPALYEGPYDVIRWSAKAINDAKLVEWSEAEFQKSMSARENSGKVV